MEILELWNWLVAPVVAAIALHLVARRASDAARKKKFFVVWGVVFVPTAVYVGFLFFTVWFSWAFGGIFGSAEAFLLTFSIMWSVFAIWTLRALSGKQLISLGKTRS